MGDLDSVLSSSPISIYAIGEEPPNWETSSAESASGSPNREAGAAGTGQRSFLPNLRIDPEVEEFLPESRPACQAFFTGITENHPCCLRRLSSTGSWASSPTPALCEYPREAKPRVLRQQSLQLVERHDPDGGRSSRQRAHRVRDLVVAQVDAMKRGEISEEELDNTKAGLVRRLRSESDSQSALVRRRLTREIMGGIASPEELVSRILAVGKDDVVAVAEKAELKAVYALRAKDDGANG